jgi:hypothetical protein
VQTSDAPADRACCELFSRQNPLAEGRNDPRVANRWALLILIGPDSTPAASRGFLCESAVSCYPPLIRYTSAGRVPLT